MNKKELYHFFEGTATTKQGMKIKAWLEASEEHVRILQKERKLFDAILLNAESNRHKENSRPTYLPSKRLFGWMRMAGVIIITLFFSYLYTQYQSLHSSPEMNTISIPAGQRANITLSDGTNVWLNARTTLQYPASFRGKQRKVILKGEAYFEVTEDKKRPFIVETEIYNVEVLGTAFNVDAYPERKTFETALMKGSVKIAPKELPEQTVVLKPDQKVNLKHGKLQIGQVEDYDPYRWKEGLICFKNNSFNHIMKEFEKYYGVKIEIRNSSVTKYNYTGKFRQADGIDYALRVLQENIHFNYEKDNEKQIIHINN